jgi:hypothetical protein
MSAPPPRKNRFFRFLPSFPVSRDATRKLLLKATVTGLSALSLGSTSPSLADTRMDLSVPTIENRNRRGFAKLVLRLRGANGRLVASHGSHASHSSHASHASHTSHYSSSGSSSATSEPSPSPSAPRPGQESGNSPTAIEHTTHITITGIDTEERKITGRDASHSEFVFYYARNVSVRKRGSASAKPLDQLTHDHPESLPFKWGSKITVTWTATPDGQKNAVGLALD